ncbi:MAG: sugar phosphate isomerase/epimerase family protein [Pseudomonadota bacterium]|nr:sugar phosphate isomerase/epimerase family protein [Pseudomonadota bacterium]
MIYISTGGFRGRVAGAVSEDLLSAGIKFIELSGGAYSDTLLSDLQALAQDIHFQIHNYFPPPEDAFVLNLGSLDTVIGERSIAHVEQALKWCVALGADRYSFHAGFLLDPKVDELGQRIPSRSLFDRDECIEAFVSRVTRLAEIAERAGVTLMVENNVLSAKNAYEFPVNPLLMCDPQECQKIMGYLPSSVRLLIDVAHLKVSANSLCFDSLQMFDLCHERTAGYHLSDNNGLEDSNKLFGEDAWFWPHIRSDVDYYSVEVYDCTPDQLLKQANLVRSKLQLFNQAI